MKHVKLSATSITFCGREFNYVNDDHTKLLTIMEDILNNETSETSRCLFVELSDVTRIAMERTARIARELKFKRNAVGCELFFLKGAIGAYMKATASVVEELFGTVDRHHTFKFLEEYIGFKKKDVKSFVLIMNALDALEVTTEDEYVSISMRYQTRYRISAGYINTYVEAKKDVVKYKKEKHEEVIKEVKTVSKIPVITEEDTIRDAIENTKQFRGKQAYDYASWFFNAGNDIPVILK